MRTGQTPNEIQGQLRLATPEENASTGTFSRHVIRHRICPRCGIHPYAPCAEGNSPKCGNTAAVYVRCLQGIGHAPVPVTDFGGPALHGAEARAADQRGRKHAWSPGGLLRVWTKG